MRYPEVVRGVTKTALLPVTPIYTAVHERWGNTSKNGPSYYFYLHSVTRWYLLDHDVSCSGLTYRVVPVPILRWIKAASIYFLASPLASNCLI